jgi:hypothetical protein
MNRNQFVVRLLLFFIVAGLVFGGIFYIVRSRTVPERYLARRTAEAEEASREIPSGFYRGTLAAGTFQGKGHFEFRTGETYTGDWNNGVPQGEGVFQYKNDGVYKGHFLDGMRSGKGDFTWPDGSLYQGNWENDKLSGEGSLTFPDGLVLSGTFAGNGLLKGWLHGKNKDGEYAFGVFANQRISSVKLTTNLQVQYSGAYKDRALSGQGTVTFPNGDQYTGLLVNGEKEGRGRYVWAKSGSVYEGLWHKDKMHGEGVYYYRGEKFRERLTGKFANDRPSGTCEYYDAYSARYVTVWSKGKCTKITRKK